MTLRITRQYVDVLSPGAGKARVTRQYVDVLLDATREVASSDLVLVDSTTLQGIFGRVATNGLALVGDSDVRGPIYFQIHHVLHLDELVAEHLSVIHLAVVDVIELADEVNRAGRDISAVASNVLAFVQSGASRKTGIVQSNVAFSQVVSAGKGKSVSHVLVLSQNIMVQATLFQPVADVLGLIQSGTYELVGPSCTLRHYQPFVGFSSDPFPAPPAVIPPTLGSVILTLTYPFLLPTLTVVLRNPEFTNKDRLNFNRINRQTRGGTLVVYADPIWPKTQRLAVEVRCLKPPQVDNLLTFFTQSLGQEVGLLDHENRQWRGIIIDPDTAIANPEHGDYTVSFEFEGELV